MDQPTIKPWDQVRLLSSRRVNYLSAPPGSKTSPQGVWVVAAWVGQELLLTQGAVVIKITPEDVTVVHSHDPETQLRSLFDGQR